MRIEEHFRAPTPSEQELLNRLLEADFPGRDDLVVMFRDLEVRHVDDDGCLALRSRAAGRAEVVHRVPVEGEARDEDGVTIHVLLHVADGRPIELEMFKEDNSPVKRMPPAAALELIALPTMPVEQKFPRG